MYGPPYLLTERRYTALCFNPYRWFLAVVSQPNSTWKAKSELVLILLHGEPTLLYLEGQDRACSDPFPW
jgi:hypothetical protein